MHDSVQKHIASDQELILLIKKKNKKKERVCNWYRSTHKTLCESRCELKNLISKLLACIRAERTQIPTCVRIYDRWSERTRKSAVRPLFLPFLNLWVPVQSTASQDLPQQKCMHKRETRPLESKRNSQKIEKIQCSTLQRCVQRHTRPYRMAVLLSSFSVTAPVQWAAASYLDRCSIYLPFVSACGPGTTATTLPAFSSRTTHALICQHAWYVQDFQLILVADMLFFWLRVNQDENFPLELLMMSTIQARK